MLFREFDKLKVCDLHEISKLEVYEYFLTPELEKQKAEKKIGDVVTVYKVIEIKPNGNTVYMPYYPILEEGK